VVDEELASSWRENFRFATRFRKSSRAGILYSKVNNNLYWVAPLLHSGFLNGLTIKKELQDMLWFRRQMNDVRLVQNVAKAIKIKYQQGLFSE
jgi:hypothetical protein